MLSFERHAIYGLAAIVYILANMAIDWASGDQSGIRIGMATSGLATILSVMHDSVGLTPIET